MVNQINNDNYQFPTKILKNNPLIVIDIYGYYHDYFSNFDKLSKIRVKKFLMLKRGELLGYAKLFSESKNPNEKEQKFWFYEFLKKFGKRLLLDDILDKCLLGLYYRRYQIHFQTMLSGYHCFTRNPEEFIKAVRKSENEEEFLILAGLL